MPSLGLCDDLEGWNWEGGREAQEEGDIYIYIYIYIYIIMTDFELLCGRNQHSIIKQFSSN